MSAPLPPLSPGSTLLVTGATGFLGRHVCRVLTSDYPEVLVTAACLRWGRRGLPGVHAEVACDLCDPGDVADLVSTSGPFDAVLHLAGYNGGIAFNRAAPFDIFVRNTQMACNLLDACVNQREAVLGAGLGCTYRPRPVGKFLGVVASCAYPSDEGYQSWHIDEVRHGWLEEEHFLGHHNPHSSVACHGEAKRNLLRACYFAHKQHGLDAVCACPTTLFGPGDSYDLERTKVTGALVRRFIEAKRSGAEKVTLWGTGQAERQLLFVGDAARLLLLSLVRHDDHETPLNLARWGPYGSVRGQHLILDLARRIQTMVGYEGRIEWDTNKPDGQYRKALIPHRAYSYFPDFQFVPFDDALAATVADCEKWLDTQKRAA